jgi:outer membrane lipoprotein carrier protein
VKHLRTILFVCCWFVATSTFLPAEEVVDEKALKDAREIVRHIQSRYEQTKDLQADFTQKTRIEGFATPVSSSGRVYIKKPGRLRWDYVEPAVEEIYVMKDDVKMYVPEHKQVLIGKLTQMAASQAPLQLLQGVAKISEEFDVLPTPPNTRSAGGARSVTLMPKLKDGETVQTLQRIVVDVFPKTYFLKTVALHELSGNVATFEFSGLKANTGLKDEVFDFKAPADVEVVKAPTLSPP